MAATFPTAQEIRWAAADDDYFSDLRAKIDGEPDKRRFDALVEAEFTAAGRRLATALVTPLTDGEKRILKFAGERLPYFRTPGACEQAIRYHFECSAVAYHQVLNSLIGRPEALRFAPNTVNRLRARRAARRVARCTAGLGRAA